MAIYIANPLYDVVFKYLMEDERIAKTIFSALLQKQVVAVKMRRHEYSNISRDAISMFRVDFAATVKEDNGEERLILIELQKTWLETETLRFRQYLAVQYNNKENMREDTDGKYALPTVAVYLLGHRIGQINNSVVYAKHKIYDYDGNEVSLDKPDPFVESLQHDSIIVQIPLLHGRVNNRLEKVLSVFDQTMIYPQDQHVLELDDQTYADDADMTYILHRLVSAAATPDIRNRMNAEDEFFKALEDRDTEIMQSKKLLQEKEVAIQKQEATIQQKNATIRAAVSALYQMGMSVADIAKKMEMDEETVAEMVE